MGIFDNAKEVWINNKKVKSIVSTEGNMTLYLNATMVSPSSLVLQNMDNSSVPYGTFVHLVATYDEADDNISNQTVTLYDNDVEITTGTTDSNGEVTFNLTSLSIGSHSFKAECNYANSSSISVTVTKITPTISLGSQGCTYGENLVVSGTLSVGTGKSVKIYQGETLIDTVTTGSGGAFSKSVSGLNAGTHQFTAVYEGDATHNSVTSSVLSATVSRLNTNLTINVPTLIYSDEFNVIGVLKDANNNPLPNMTVSLVWNDGSNHSVNATTGNDGSVTFHRSAPTSITEYSFQIGFTGTTNYGATSSSTVSKTPQKETTIINMTAPLSVTTTINEGGTATISGALVTDDNEKLSGKSIKISDGQTLLTTLTTDNNGAFSTTLSNLSVETHTINIAFETDTYYTASSVSRTIIVSYIPIPTTLSVSATKGILSYNESSTLNATVLDQRNNPMGGETVYFYEVITPTFNITATKDTIQSGDTTDIYANVKDNDGSIAKNTKVYFYQKFGEIPTTLSVTADKSILSYADGDKAVLTAKLTGESVRGKSVVFKKGSTVLDTVTTDGSGEASYEYTSQGVGDVTLTVECMGLQETYSIEDCTYFRTTSYTTSSTTLNIPLPSHFTLEYVLKQGDTSSSVPYLDIGDSSNNRMLVGQYARTGANGLIVYKSSSTTHAYSTNTTPNEENTIWFKYDGTKYYYKLNDGAIMEVADANVTLTKVIHSEGGGYGSNYLKNIKIKPL